jgi:hypothetical protein
MATVLTQPAAAALTALVLLLLALMLVMIGALLTPRPSRPLPASRPALNLELPPRRPAPSGETLGTAGLAALMPLIRKIERRPLESMMVAAGLGVLLAALRRRK